MIVIIFTLIFLAGICNGIMDSIAWHDSYANYGEWWSLGSWKDKKFLGLLVPNAWHVFKYLMLSFIFISMTMAFFYGGAFSYQKIISCFIFSYTVFSIGFNTSYK